MWSVVLMREVRKEKGPIRGPEPVVTYIAIEYDCVLSHLAWLLVPFVKKCLDAQDLEDQGNLFRQQEIQIFHNGCLDGMRVVPFSMI
jgi:hypothetical protein